MDGWREGWRDGGMEGWMDGGREGTYCTSILACDHVYMYTYTKHKA
jgi:hypothetical protein